MTAYTSPLQLVCLIREQTCLENLSQRKFHLPLVPCLRAPPPHSIKEQKYSDATWRTSQSCLTEWQPAAWAKRGGSSQHVCELWVTDVVRRSSGSDWLFCFGFGGLQIAVGAIGRANGVVFFITDYMAHVLLSGHGDSFSKYYITVHLLTLLPYMLPTGGHNIEKLSRYKY